MVIRKGVFPAIISMSAQKLCKEQKQNCHHYYIPRRLEPGTDSLFVLSLTRGGRPVGVL